MTEKPEQFATRQRVRQYLDRYYGAVFARFKDSKPYTDIQAEMQAVEDGLTAMLSETATSDEPVYCPTCGAEDGGTTCGMPDCGLRCAATIMPSAELCGTPRTDAKERESEKCDPKTHAHYGWKFARQLEREVQGLSVALGKAAVEIDELRSAASATARSGDGHDGR